MPATTGTTATPTPLTTDKPDSITELFDRYPDIPDEAIDRVIAHLRETRAQIGADQKPVKVPKPKAEPKGKGPARPKLTAEELALLLDVEIKI